MTNFILLVQFLVRGLFLVAQLAPPNSNKLSDITNGLIRVLFSQTFAVLSREVHVDRKGSLGLKVLGVRLHVSGTLLFFFEKFSVGFVSAFRLVIE